LVHNTKSYPKSEAHKEAIRLAQIKRHRERIKAQIENQRL